MPEPGYATQLIGRLAFGFAEIQPFLPTYLHIILAAIFPIVTAAHASLSRPASAAKPGKDGMTEVDTDEDDEDEYQRMEGLTPSDALLFPLYAGLALTSLYYLIKWLQDPAILNKMLNWYFAIVGLYGVCKFISDTLSVIHSFIFPSYYVGGSGLWHVDQSNHTTLLVTADGSELKTSTSPLPGLLSLIPLPQKVLQCLWMIRGIAKPSQRLTIKFYVHKLFALRAHFNTFNVLGLLLGCCSVLYFNLVDKTWWLTNLMGFSFSYSALQLMSPTTFTTGGLLLVGLFLYDIYMVFYTPMMVTVAKSLDIPIKLLFPRPSTASGKDALPVQEFAMLGLGDIVLPGLVIALALRYDLYLHYLRLQRKRVLAPESKTDVAANDTQDEEITIIKVPYTSPSRHWSSRFWTGRTASVPIISNGTFKKPYFFASLAGYICGMIVTLLAMHLSAHPQPALLYLVPGVLGSLVLTALIRGEGNLMWSFSEEEVPDESVKLQNDAKEDKKKEKTSKRSIFSLLHDQRDSPIIHATTKLLDPVQGQFSGEDDTRLPTQLDRERPSLSQGKAEPLKESVGRSHDRELLHFSISSYKPRRLGGKVAAKEESDKQKWVESKTVEKKVTLEHGHVAKKLRTA